MKSNKKHYHLSLHSLHKFPLRSEKQPQWFHIHYWKNIKNTSSSQRLPVQEKWKWMSTAALSITAISHLDRDCWHKTRTDWLRHLQEKIEHTPVSPCAPWKDRKSLKILHSCTGWDELMWRVSQALLLLFVVLQYIKSSMDTASYSS